jgi:hypothetical protein
MEQEKVTINGIPLLVTFGKFEDIDIREISFYENIRTLIIEIGGTLYDALSKLGGRTFSYRVKMNMHTYIGQKFNRADITYNGKYEITFLCGSCYSDFFDLSDLNRIPIKIDFADK